MLDVYYGAGNSQSRKKRVVHGSPHTWEMGGVLVCVGRLFLYCLFVAGALVFYSGGACKVLLRLRTPTEVNAFILYTICYFRWGLTCCVSQGREQVVRPLWPMSHQ